MKKKRIIVGVIALVIIFLIAGRMLLLREEVELAPAMERAALAVRVAEVVRGDIRESISLTGSIEAEKTVKVYPRVSGKIIRKNVVEGDRVAKGDIIALIDRDMPGFRFEAAPVDTFLGGIVGQIYVDLGDRVTPHTPVALIVDMDRIRVRVEVPERDIPRLQIGQEAGVEVVAHPDEVFIGQVEKISPLVDVISRRAAVEITIPNPGHRLRPGMFARVRIVTAEREDALIVPREAVLPREGKEIVYIVDLPLCLDLRQQIYRGEGVAKIREVETGIIVEEKIEIISGIEVGDKVIIAGHLGLKEGARVNVK